MVLLRNIGAHQYNFGLGLALRLYRSFVRPVLEYGLAIFTPTATQYTALEKVQIRCIRLALNVTDPAATTPTIVPLHLADLPSIKLRARILLFKFLCRAFRLPPSTLLACVVSSFLRRHHPPDYWRVMTTNKLWVDEKEVTRQAPLPRDPMQHVIDSHHQQELQSRRNRFSTVRRALPERRWDPILFLPATNLARHRLVKWRMHWLPSYPLKDCRCGKVGANRRHYTNDCPLLAPMVEQLRNSFPGPVQDDQHLLDAVFNSLPNKATALKNGHWRSTWPVLLLTLRDIDICSHPDATFDPEPHPRQVLDGFFSPPSPPPT
ncbi:hypothetical protein BDB00DRAFT_777773 [Zychaea mexicana]|uniref:uncharacterized protein n=1 Tax=Zychaea mexicana TaxID=64656 RepID=UPI0022FDB8CB|nr:uncharacterized protein BDB00DRAFT_777773 [Zychaea mexicana]KAI9466508.1 hypothetical protein BDB00DRAFT_777773 [Zychaea mexicana]